MNATENAIHIVLSGGIIIFPTDTAFGIGCRIDNYAAVDRLFKIRKRPTNQPMPVLVDSPIMSLSYFDSPSDIVRRLMKQHWPGGLTIIAKCKQNVIYSPIRGGGDTVGLRMPNHETILKIIEGVGVPMLGPSANFHTEPTPYSIEDLNPELVKMVDYVVPGECLAERDPASQDTLKEASTVVDCSVTPYKIIRQGAVKI